MQQEFQNLKNLNLKNCENSKIQTCSDPKVRRIQNLMSEIVGKYALDTFMLYPKTRPKLKES